MKPFRAIPYAIPFRRPIVTAAGRWAVRRGEWILLSEEGWHGLGDAPHLGPYVIDGGGGGRRSRQRSLAAALDLARLDIEGQRTGRPIAALLGPDLRPGVAVNALVFSRDVEASAAEAAEAVAHGFRTVKLKAGVGPPTADVERIAEVRSRIGGTARIRIDANGAWDEETALHVMKAIERYDIEYVEDPVAGNPRSIRNRAGIAIACDAPTRDRALAVITGGEADVLVLKPALLGGIRPAREIASLAIEAGIGVVVSTVFETAVGIAGGVHLAASLPGPERAHGLGTVSLLEEHPVRGLELPHDGMISTPMLPGLGVDLEGITT